VSRRHRRAKTDRIDGEAALIRTLMAYKRGEPRVCSMVQVPTLEDEDRRRICRERKALVAERVSHVNRFKGLLFSQGIRDYEPLRRDRRARLDALRTGDGRPLSGHLKAQICRELDRIELLLEQLKAVEAERDAVMTEQVTNASSPAAMLLGIKGICLRSALMRATLRAPSTWHPTRPMRTMPTGWRSSPRLAISRRFGSRALTAC
jgi:transposase